MMEERVVQLVNELGGFKNMSTPEQQELDIEGSRVCPLCKEVKETFFEHPFTGQEICDQCHEEDGDIPGNDDWTN